MVTHSSVVEPLKPEVIFSYSHWHSRVKELHHAYVTAEPYPHIVMDNFLSDEIVEEAVNEFPSLDSKDWIHYIHANEQKYGKTDLSKFPPLLREIVEELNSSRFVHFLSELTGIKNLLPDPGLEGGGLHQTGRGGYLNIHADFTGHPHHRNWRRRINVLIYLNKNWKTSYRGHLELWDRSMKRRIKKVMPILNRSVIFNTDLYAYHGHPVPLACPQGVTRKSIALYYFTAEKDRYLVRSTEYRPRPHDTFNRIIIFLDKWILRAYDRFKRITGINDRFASNLLKAISRINKKIRKYFHGS